MRDFKTLDVWRYAHQLTLDVYQATRSFPKEEIYGLTNQLRRASSSIPANLAEGFSREGEKERAHFVNIAIGSSGEVEYFLLLARDLGLLSDTQYQALTGQIARIQRMLASLYRKLRDDSPAPTRS